MVLSKIWVRNLETMETKKQIRKRLLAVRNAMSKETVKELSEKISRNLQEYFDKQTELKICGVYGYYPHGNEVSLMVLYMWLLERQIPLAFPRVSGDTMEFYQVTSMHDFDEGAFHIMEPKEHCRLAKMENAICLVPGSVFDNSGNRYGYGKGYYDRYFDLHKELMRIGIAYQLQIESTIPAEETDVKMHGLATEAGLKFF